MAHALVAVIGRQRMADLCGFEEEKEEMMKKKKKEKEKSGCGSAAV